MFKKCLDAVDCVIFAGEKQTFSVVLLKREELPFLGDWSLPGSLCATEEDPVETAIKACQEKTSLSLRPKQAHMLSLREKEGRDPRGDRKSFPFLFYVGKELLALKGNARWVRLDQIEKLAFDHGAILNEALGHFWEEFYPAEKFFEAQLPTEFKSFSAPSCKYFPGSFYPWHKGHQACLDFAGENTIVIPDHNPFKPLQDIKCFWRAYRELNRKINAPLFPGYFGLEYKNPTASWLPSTVNEKKVIVMGEDSFLSLPNWLEAEKLLKALSVIEIVPRGKDKAYIKRLSEELLEQFPHLKFIFHGDHPYKEMSSSELRSLKKD